MERKHLYLICFVICLGLVFSGCGKKDERSSKTEAKTEVSGEYNTSSSAAKRTDEQPEGKTGRKKDTESSSKEKENSKKKLGEKADFEISEKVICMEVGDVRDILVDIKTKDSEAANEGGDSQGDPEAANASTPEEIEETAAAYLQWSSNHPEIAEVDENGLVTGVREGSAVISCKNKNKEESLCINVYDGFGGGSWWDMEMQTSPDKVDVYRNFAQGAYEYGDYSKYVAWHGCAVCCATTIIRAMYPDEDWTPDKVIRELEPEANSEGWENNYAKSVRKQMPLTLKGISRVLEVKDIKHKYVTEFDKETVTEDLARELRQGRPIIYESHKRGYHMLLLLGIMADDTVMISDSVGQNRVRLSTLEDVADRMFSCKKEPKSSYFAGKKTAGGYIIVGKE